MKMLAAFKDEFISFMKDESGVGVIEVVLILVVLIGLVIIFKDSINTLLNGIFRRPVRGRALYFPVVSELIANIQNSLE